MKTFGKIICLCGILIFTVMLCSAADQEALSESKIKETFKLDPNITDGERYKVMTGETIKKPTTKILMKVEIPVKKRTADKLKLSYLSQEIEVFKDLKKGHTDLLSNCIAKILGYGYYDGKKVLIILRLGKNLKEYSSKPYSWDKLSKIGPCMIKAIKLLHSKNYVHRYLKPDVFAFGTEEKQPDKESVPLKSQVYLFDVGLADNYRHSNGSHKAMKNLNEFFGEMAYASTGAMNNKTQSRRNDIESLYYVLAYLAGLTEPFEEKDLRELFHKKNDFCTDQLYIHHVFKHSNVTDVRVFNAFFDFAFDMSELFRNSKDYEKEPEYDDFVNCFDQGISEKDIKAKYEFDGLKKFQDKSASAFIGYGNTTSDPKNKMEVVMKLMKPDHDLYPNLEGSHGLNFKDEIRVYRDLKKGTKHSLIRENVCDMLDHGVFDDRRAIIMPRLGIDWYEDVSSWHGYTYELLCPAARCAINGLRFIHKKGYLHQDLKLENFALGRVEYKKGDKSQVDKPLKNRLYLFDFGMSAKWKYANGTHKPRVKINLLIGTVDYRCRTAIMEYQQGRRDDMESLLYTFAAAATPYPMFTGYDQKSILKERNEFITVPRSMINHLSKLHVSDPRVHKAFTDYAAELNKLFVSDAPEYHEKEPDYNALCVCFGGKPGDNACAVE